ncbi:MAG: ComF family protein, partial [Candidatus Colwellbacteria bacterium]|nr:ComF family protein [Candidatus Colwellbacteria bacterium]
MVSLLDILFPPICLSCRIYLNGLEEKENLLCDACFTGIRVYSNVFRPDPQFNLMAIGSYNAGALREIIHYFKYNGFLAARVPLEKLIIKWLDLNHPLIPIFLLPNSCIVPIPLHKSRLRNRGFNQAELIAQTLSQLFQLPLEKTLLERTRDT